jgi:hypothetical protein
VPLKTLNVLSERFKVITVNDTHYFENEWIDFESDGSKKILRKKRLENFCGYTHD